MRNSTLFELFATFENTEWQKFNDFLKMRMRENAEIILLYDYISQYKRNLSHKNLKISTANEALFKNKTQKNFLNLMSKLHQHCLDFFSYQNFQSDEREQELHIIESLNKRGLYAKAIKRYESFQTASNEWPLDIWNNLFKLRAAHLMNYSDNHIWRSQKEERVEVLVNSWKTTQHNLNAYYLNDHLHMQLTSRAEVQRNLAWLEAAEKENLGDDDISKTLYELRELTNNDSLESFNWLYEQLVEGNKNYSPSLASAMLIYMIQYLQRSIQYGDNKINQLFELYQFGMKTELLLDHGKITPARFTSMIHTTCLSQQTDLATQFLEQWATKLHRKYQDTIPGYCQAMIYFYEEKHEDSIRILAANKYQKGWDNNAARIFLLMNYFVLYHETEPGFVLTQIENVRSYFKRNEQYSTPRFLQGAANMISILSELTRKKDYNHQLQKVRTISPLIRRQWLQGYLNQKTST